MELNLKDWPMSCCSDVMEPIQASSCCTPQDTAADDRRASEVRVEAIMQPSSACCDADESIEDARRKLHEHRATTLPVVDKAGGCCGTVSIHNLQKP